MIVQAPSSASGSGAGSSLKGSRDKFRVFQGGERRKPTRPPCFYVKHIRYLGVVEILKYLGIRSGDPSKVT